MLKRVFPESALAVLYFMAGLLLVLMAFRGRKASSTIGTDAKRVSFFAAFLVAIYALQLSTTFFSPFALAFSHFLYMAIPLSFIIVIHRYAPEFDLSRLATVFLILMIPINIVGLIQYLVNPGFLISTSYSATGGIIDRNFFIGGYFSRFPSLFASADRYSAMALMQFFFSVVLLAKDEKLSRKQYLWGGANVLMSFVALGISGARSRILIAIVEVFFLGAIQVIPMFNLKGVSAREGVRRLIVLFLGMVGVSAFFYLVYSPKAQDFPILAMLNQTFDSGDVGVRINEALELSRPTEQVSLAGLGLGTQSLVPGKPGEFGLMSIWAESGLFWGIPLIISFMGMIFVLFKLSFKAAITGKGLFFVHYSFPLLILIFGLLSGLTAAFELSTGVLLCCIVASVTRLTPQGT